MAVVCLLAAGCIAAGVLLVAYWVRLWNRAYLWSGGTQVIRGLAAVVFGLMVLVEFVSGNAAIVSKTNALLWEAGVTSRVAWSALRSEMVRSGLRSDVLPPPRSVEEAEKFASTHPYMQTLFGDRLRFAPGETHNAGENGVVTVLQHSGTQVEEILRVRGTEFVTGTRVYIAGLVLSIEAACLGGLAYSASRQLRRSNRS